MLGPALIIRKLIYKKQIGKIYAAIVVGLSYFLVALANLALSGIPATGALPILLAYFGYKILTKPNATIWIKIKIISLKVGGSSPIANPNIFGMPALLGFVKTTHPAHPITLFSQNTSIL